MPKYDAVRKTGRDKKIVRYSRDHPDYSQQEIADHFGICRSNVSRILTIARKGARDATS